jgi:superfamily II DNA/RNA helicase
MFKGNFKRSSRFGNSSSRHRRSDDSRDSRSDNRRPSRPSSGRGGRFTDQKINPALFVRKAEPVAKAEAYQPKNAFADFDIHGQIKENIHIKGYTTPTPIQDETIPHIVKGLDIVGIANTGTGKTAAFLIPLLNKVMLNPQENILIIVPTRELADQINQEFFDFRGRLKIFSVCCVGGMPIGRQMSDLRRSYNFLIGTPGRLKDLINRRAINPAQFSTIVLDEADRMLDMGFVNDMKFIMEKMPKNRQTLFFSATSNKDVDKLIQTFLTNPIMISVKTGDTAKNIEQNVIRVRSEQERLEVLHQILAKPEFSKVLIFGRTKYGVERLSATLIQSGFKADAIHGNKNQNKRQMSLHLFKTNRTTILVATDVAARGLDIPNVSHVINYDLPANYDDYIHRIGRTGRGDQMGNALTFIS